MGFVGKLLFEHSDSEAREGSFQGVELLLHVHGPKVCSGAAARNLVVSVVELVR